MVRHEKSGYVEQSDKRKSVRATIIAVVIVLFIAAGIFLYMQSRLSEQEARANYNGFEFMMDGEFWKTEVQYQGLLAPVVFRYHPMDVEQYYFQPEAKQLVLYKPHTGFIVAVRDNVGSRPVVAGVNIARIIGKLYGFEVQSALYIEEDQRSMYNTTHTMVTCDDATSLAPIIFIDVNATQNQVVLDKENPACIRVESVDAQDNVLMMGDVFTYRILGIIV